MDNTEKVPFDNWCIIDLFGHQQIAGHVTEQAVAGQGFVRIDVPETDNQPAYTRMFGPGAIYSIIPTTEEICREFASRNSAAPIQPWQLQQPRLPERDGDGLEDFEDKDEDEDEEF